MLIDDFGNGRTGFIHRTGLSHDEVVRPVRKRVREAVPFVLDQDAVAMACNVALSKPSSILSALPWIRLPFRSIFIEWSSEEARTAMRDLGSPLKKAPSDFVHVERVGFLLTQGETPEAPVTIDYIHRDRTGSGGPSLTDVAPVQLRFVRPTDLPDNLDEIAMMFAQSAKDDDATGRVRNHLELMTTDPYEAACDDAIRACISWVPHPDMAPVARSLKSFMGDGKVAEIERNQAMEALRHIKLVLIPALILLNARNAVTIEDVPAPEKLNKKRAKEGKAPLLGHRIVRLRLDGARAKSSIAKNGGGESNIRGTLVRGHFKIRKTGIFWWSPHPRRGMGAVTTSYEITAGPTPR
jgi:hypothetical protein